MSTKADSLRSIFLDVTNEESITEHQEQGPSHDPLDEQDIHREDRLAAFASQDGLDDAVDGSESN